MHAAMAPDSVTVRTAAPTSRAAGGRSVAAAAGARRPRLLLDRHRQRDLARVRRVRRIVGDVPRSTSLLSCIVMQYGKNMIGRGETRRRSAFAALVVLIHSPFERSARSSKYFLTAGGLAAAGAVTAGGYGCGGGAPATTCTTKPVGIAARGALHHGRARPAPWAFVHVASDIHRSQHVAGGRVDVRRGSNDTISHALEGTVVSPNSPSPQWVIDVEVLAVHPSLPEPPKLDLPTCLHSARRRHVGGGFGILRRAHRTGRGRGVGRSRRWRAPSAAT